jgi:c-di-GMP-binding flagellar brake protein YcgR
MPTTLVHQSRFRHSGSTCDLSTKGCRVSSVITPFTGMQVTVQLHVPGEETPITINKAAIRWCGSHGIGMEFLDVSPAQQERLQSIIHRLEEQAATTH